MYSYSPRLVKSEADVDTKPKPEPKDTPSPLLDRTSPAICLSQGKSNRRGRLVDEVVEAALTLADMSMKTKIKVEPSEEWI